MYSTVVFVLWVCVYIYVSINSTGLSTFSPYTSLTNHDHPFKFFDWPFPSIPSQLLHVPIEKSALAGDEELVHLKVDGLTGGHSGVDIMMGGANAIKVWIGACRCMSRCGVWNGVNSIKVVHGRVAIDTSVCRTISFSSMYVRRYGVLNAKASPWVHPSNPLFYPYISISNPMFQP